MGTDLVKPALTHEWWCPVLSCLCCCCPRPTNRIVKLVRAIRKGWLKVGKRRQRPQEQPMYLMWGDDDQVGEQGLDKP